MKFRLPVVISYDLNGPEVIPELFDQVFKNDGAIQVLGQYDFAYLPTDDLDETNACKFTPGA